MHHTAVGKVSHHIGMSAKKQPELKLPDEGVPETTIEKATRILKLMEPVTSLPVLSEFLKSKGLHFSAGSWTELLEKRIIPGFRARKITLEELNQLLADVEEFGRSHTFLFSTPKNAAARLMDREHLERTCHRLGNATVLRDVIIEEQPEKPTITQIREESHDGRRSWVFKVVEKREEKTFVGEFIDGDRFRKEWKIGFVRAVNVARLHESGLLEMRIQSHISSSRYDADLKAMWVILGEFLPPTKFSELSLGRAKFRLWQNREATKKKVRFSDSTMRNNIGSKIVASTATENADLFEDSSIGPSLDKFLQHGAYCDSSNIYFRPHDGVINRELHVLLLGRGNEFAITGSCTKNEYDYVLNELRLHNK
jgi:hypothetical protein